MKYWPGGLYIVTTINPIVLGGILLMNIGYKFNYRKILGFIATEGTGNTEPGDTYLPHFLAMYSNVSVRPVAHTHFLGRYFNACNEIYNHNRMRQYSIAL